MRERLMIAVTFDPAVGYIATGGELPVLAALSLTGLCRRIEDAHRGEDVEICSCSIAPRAVTSFHLASNGVAF